ncbi:MAG: serine/threonine protein phosphatase PrpC [Myxococcota bacterium]|jgi:serine/threonine protein phosphatase PrpC
MKPLRVLVALDGSPRSALALSWIRPPLVPAGSVVCVLRCVGDGFHSAAISDARRQAEWIERRGPRAYSRLVDGFDVGRIAEAAVTNAIDRILIVAPDERAGGFAPSLPARLAAGGLPVVALPRESAAQDGRARDVLVVLDGSKAAESSVVDAAAHVRETGGTLHLLRILPPFARAFPAVGRGPMESPARAELERLAATVPDVAVHTDVAHGPMAVAVGDVLGRKRFDLVLVGRPAPGRLEIARHWDLGYLRSPVCPILVRTATRPRAPSRRSSGSSASTGHVRAANEDRMVAHDRDGIYVVADGVSGCGRGAEAAQIVVDAIQSYIGPRVSKASAAPPWQLKRWMDQAIANAAVRLQVAGGLNDRPMSTTLCVAWLVGDCALLAHIGDSPIFLRREGAVRKLTTDHNVASELFQAGIIGLDAVATHPLASVLTRSLNGHDAPQPEYQVLQLLPNDRLLLCSDGLTRHMAGLDELERHLRTGSPEFVAKDLVRAALARGGLDNVSVVVVDPTVDRPRRRRIRLRAA